VGFDFVLVNLVVDLADLRCEIRILCSSCSIRNPQIGDFLPEEAFQGSCLWEELFQFLEFQCTCRVEDYREESLPI
jgi:hypothetical protein